MEENAHCAGDLMMIISGRSSCFLEEEKDRLCTTQVTNRKPPAVTANTPIR